MIKQLIIDRTLNAINNLPTAKAEEIADFADFIFKRFEEQRLSKGIMSMMTDSNSFNFLNEDEVEYKLTDLKEVYND